MNDSGRMHGRRMENRRREGTPYGIALQTLRETGGRKSATARYTKYMHAMLESLSVRATELVSKRRSSHRWKQKRSMMRFISRLCDRLFNRTSLRVGKSQEAHEPIDETKRKELHARLNALKERRRSMPTVVFFGDGSFGPTMRGHNSIPKKAILRELCHRGVTVLLDEYKTSKVCPCGQDELITTTGRLRAHKSDGAICSLINNLSNEANDRDALASLNMISCALCALNGRDRPHHLCRSCRACEP